MAVPASLLSAPQQRCLLSLQLTSKMLIVTISSRMHHATWGKWETARAMCRQTWTVSERSQGVCC